MFFMNFMQAPMTRLKAQIERLSNHGMPQETFLYANINEFQNGKKRNLMLKAQDYYKNENDIKDRKRYYIDRYGTQRELKNLANSKLSHPFMRKLTNQKVNYLLSKELNVQCDNEVFSEHIMEYFDKDFLRLLKNLGRDSIVNGIAWLQVYYNYLGELCFKRIPPEEVIPFWADADHTLLEAVIRYYKIINYKLDGNKEEITKVEYHTNEGVWYYVMTEDGLIPDEEKGNGIRGHFTVSADQMNTGEKFENHEDVEEIQMTWGKIPFVAFKYNPDEISLLTWIKSLIDDYDVNTSETSNILQDVPNSIKIVKNYDGTEKEEFMQNLAKFRTAFVTQDGDVTALETKLDIGAIDSHLNRLRKDIYEAGNGVDTQETSLGNASGVALKFRYADLDNDTDDMASEYLASLDELMWFIKADLYSKNLGDFMNVDYDIIFNTDNIINESEVIQDAKNSLGIISEETIIVNHPWVTDSQQEIERVEKERKEKLEEFMNENYGFAPDEPNEEDKD